METSLNLSRLNRNNLDTARILSACSVCQPAELLPGKDLPIRNESVNTVKNKTISDQQLLVDRIVEVLEKSLVLLVEKVVTKLEESLNKSGTPGNNSLEQENPKVNSEAVLPEQNCLCLQTKDTSNLLNNQFPQNITKDSSIDSYLQNGLLGFSLADSFKDSFAPLKDLFAGLFESLKSFLKKPAGMLKSLFKGGIFSGAAKLLGGLL